MDQTTGSFTAQIKTGYAFNCIRAPIGAHIGKNGSGVGEQVPKEH